GGGGGGEGSQGGGGSQAAARSMLFRASQFTVTNLTPDVTMLEPGGEVRTLHADDKTYDLDDGTTQVKARWDDAKLVVETKTQRGRVKETWSVANDPKRLTVLLEVDRPWGGTAKIKRVFDPATPGAPAEAGSQAPKPAAGTTEPAAGTQTAPPDAGKATTPDAAKPQGPPNPGR
ncbi:MAG TPA: hypothetical protein VEQ10_04315, partial [Vicinamibacteria bacterium]|nr:hypothetical protein [Vicinamibacteria bacterium]